jgi:monoterpene epsilon-lactone hydrolase
VVSPQVEAAKDVLRAWRAQAISAEAAPTLAEQRASTALFAEFTGVPDGVTYEDVDAGGVPSQWTLPAGGADDRVVLYVHGGGYVVCSVASHSRLVGHIANAVGCRALSVDYRLAPEHPHPAAVTDSTTAYRWLLDQGFPPGHIAIAGDSAGGGLTVATLLKIRADGLPQPAAAVPISPWIDLEGTGETMDTHADLDLMCGRDGLKIMADHFLAGQDARDPLAAPLHADLAGLAPLYIQVGGHETLLSDSTRLAAHAAAAGVDVRLDVFPEMQHVFQLMAGRAPEADDAIARIGAWLRPRLGLPVG